MLRLQSKRVQKTSLPPLSDEKRHTVVSCGLFQSAFFHVHLWCKLTEICTRRVNFWSYLFLWWRHKHFLIGIPLILEAIVVIGSQSLYSKLTFTVDTTQVTHLCRNQDGALTHFCGTRNRKNSSATLSLLPLSLTLLLVDKVVIKEDWDSHITQTTSNLCIYLDV